MALDMQDIGKAIYKKSLKPSRLDKSFGEGR